MQIYWKILSLLLVLVSFTGSLLKFLLELPVDLNQDQMIPLQVAEVLRQVPGSSHTPGKETLVLLQLSRISLLYILQVLDLLTQGIAVILSLPLLIASNFHLFSWA